MRPGTHAYDLQIRCASVPVGICPEIRHCCRIRRLFGLLLLLTGSLAVSDGQPSPIRPAEPQPDGEAILRRMPLYFEPNRGQAEANVRYLARTRGMTLLLNGKGAVLIPYGASTANVTMAPVRMRLEGASMGSARADRLPGISNYFIGNDPHKWITDVPQYRQVRFREVYPGIDVVYYSNRQNLEYDFVVAPGIDPGRVQIAWEGAESVTLDRSGD